MKSYDDFFHRFERGCDRDEIKSNKSKSDVLRFTIGTEENKRTFFLKRFYHPTFKTTIRTWMQSGKLMSRGKLEWSNANFLISNGIGAYKPVCYGEKTVHQIETESFVVTEKLEMPCLDEFINDNWKSLQADQKNNILIKTAKTIRKAHSLNVSLRDIYIRHIFIAENQDNYRLSFIDLENMWQNIRNPFQKARDLGRLIFSMTDEYFDKDSKELLINTYLSDTPSFLKGVTKYLIYSRANKKQKRQLIKLKKITLFSNCKKIFSLIRLWQKKEKQAKITTVASKTQ